jgi:hypothetical protein
VLSLADLLPRLAEDLAKRDLDVIGTLEVGLAFSAILVANGA